MSNKCHVRFVDTEREIPRALDPRFPHGRDLDKSFGASRTCLVVLPYPAPACGLWRIQCDECGWLAYLTCGGQCDDPKTVKVPCKYADVVLRPSR